MAVATTLDRLQRHAAVHQAAAVQGSQLHREMDDDRTGRVEGAAAITQQGAERAPATAGRHGVEVQRGGVLRAQKRGHDLAADGNGALVRMRGGVHGQPVAMTLRNAAKENNRA